MMVNKTFYYICFNIDLFSRKVISYEVSTSNNTTQSKEAFKRAFQERDRPQNLIFHSDQGSQYVSYEFRQYLRKNKVKQSFSAPGSPHDNAVAESFFACIKKEELHRHDYLTTEELIQPVEEYIHFFNYERPHHRLKARTPEQVEIDYYAKKFDKYIITIIKNEGIFCTFPKRNYKNLPLYPNSSKNTLNPRCLVAEY